MAVSTGADNLGCGVSTPIPGVSGKLALIDRGTCAFVEKAANARAGGATGLIIANHEDVGIITAGEDPSITIPVISVTLVRTRVGEGASVSIWLGLGGCRYILKNKN